MNELCTNCYMAEMLLWKSPTDGTECLRCTNCGYRKSTSSAVTNDEPVRYEHGGTELRVDTIKRLTAENDSLKEQNGILSRNLEAAEARAKSVLADALSLPQWVQINNEAVPVGDHRVMTTIPYAEVQAFIAERDALIAHNEADCKRVHELEGENQRLVAQVAAMREALEGCAYWVDLKDVGGDTRVMHFISCRICKAAAPSDYDILHKPNCILSTPCPAADRMVKDHAAMEKLPKFQFWATYRDGDEGFYIAGTNKKPDTDKKIVWFDNPADAILAKGKE